MGSNRYKYYTQDRFDGGIENRDGYARGNQLKDARNVWVKSGDDVLKTRPGYEYVAGCFTYPTKESPHNVDSLVENPAGVFTNTVDYSSLPSSAYIYLGVENDSNQALISDAVAWQLKVSAGGTANAIMRWEYWNGVVWAPLKVTPLSMSVDRSNPGDTARLSTEIPNFLGSDSLEFYTLAFAAPKDWAASTVNATARYWIRAKQITDVTLSNPTTASYSQFAVSHATNVLGGKPAIYGYLSTSYAAGGFISFILMDQAVVRTGFTGTYVALALSVGSGSTAHKTIDPAGSNLRYTSIGELVPPQTGTPYGTFIAEAPTMAHIPQVNEFFIAYRNRIYNVSPTRLAPLADQLALDSSDIGTKYRVLTNYFDAKVEDDPVYVADPLSPLYTGSVPQLSVPPAASVIVYHANVLWATRILGERGVVRWTAPAVNGIYLGYRVWPKSSFAVLPTDEEVTGAVAVHENLIVTTERSVFAMVQVGTDTNNFPTYTPVRIADVGCIAQSSMQNIPGRAVWLANEGVFVFDGTPNYKQISDPIHQIMSRINMSKVQFSSSAHWDINNMYVLAVPLDNSDRNNALLLFDYEREAWWVWDGFEPRFIYVLNNELHFMDYTGNVFKFSAVKNDYGAGISAYAITHRLGKEERLTKTARDIRMMGYGKNVNVTLLAGDREQASSAINLGNTSDAVWDTGVWDSSTWPDENLKERRIGTRQAGRWFQLKVSTNDKTTPLQLYNVAVGYTQQGRQ